jgi:hypothetical protein
MGTVIKIQAGVVAVLLTIHTTEDNDGEHGEEKTAAICLHGHKQVGEGSHTVFSVWS